MRPAVIPQQTRTDTVCRRVTRSLAFVTAGLDKAHSAADVRHFGAPDWSNGHSGEIDSRARDERSCRLLSRQRTPRSGVSQLHSRPTVSNARGRHVPSQGSARAHCWKRQTLRQSVTSNTLSLLLWACCELGHWGCARGGKSSLGKRF